eukprot:12380040-Alexandrium_andersonii.AAC.1
MDAGNPWGAWIPQYMGWKYLTWPRLQVPDLRGVVNDPRCFGWSLEAATRAHAQLASTTLG